MIFVIESTYNMPFKRKYHGDSKSLIKVILNDLYYDTKAISDVSCRINGIIGSVLSHRYRISKEKIYDFYKRNAF